jgi:hypothetical protein
MAIAKVGILVRTLLLHRRVPEMFGFHSGF